MGTRGGNGFEGSILMMGHGNARSYWQLKGDYLIKLYINIYLVPFDESKSMRSVRMDTTPH